MNVKQISLIVENKPGTLHDAIVMLSKNDIHVKAITVEDTHKSSIIRIIVDNILWTASILKNAGFETNFVDVLVTKISNVPGGLNHVLEVLDNAEINIEHMYSIMHSLNSGSTEEAYVVFEISDIEKALTIFKDEHIEIIDQEHLSLL